MKNLTLLMIAIWSFIGLAIIAAIIFFTIFLNNDKGDSFTMMMFGEANTSGMPLVAEETIPMDGIKQIELELFADSCNIYFTDSDSIGLKHYARNIPQDRYARADVSGGTLNISTRPRAFGFFSPFGFMSHSAVDVLLPEAYREALAVNLSSGTLRLNGDAKLSELVIKISSGSIRSEHLVEAQNVEVTAASGLVRLLGGVKAENYALKTSSGSISVGEKLEGSGSVTATSGKISLEGVDITENLSVKTSSGTVSIEIADDASLKFTGKVSSGIVRAYFNMQKDGRSYSATVGEGPYKNLDVQVTSGTVRITED